MSDNSGSYIIYRQKRSDIRCSIRYDGKAVICCPKGVSKKIIFGFIKENIEKISEMQCAAYVKSYEKLVYDVEKPSLPFLGERYPLMFGSCKKFCFESGIFFSPSSEPDEVRKSFREFLRKEAKEYFSARVPELARLHGFEYKSFRVRADVSRWGSCSSVGNLNFSLALLVCAPDYIDSVILHELCHTVYLNHGVDFHRLLDKVCPENRILTQNGKKLYSGLPGAICADPVKPISISQNYL